jgi:hypothetical protein
MISWFTLDNVIKKLNMSEGEILARRVAEDISYSEKTDKYDISSILQTRTMTIGIEKFLTPAEKAFLLTKMESYTKLYMQIFNRMQRGEVFASSGTDRLHRILAKELGLEQIFADSAMSMATGLYLSVKTWKIKHEANIFDTITEIRERLEQKLNYKKGLKRVLHKNEVRLANSLASQYKKIWFGNKKPEALDSYRKSRLSLFAAGTAGKGNLKFGIVFGKIGYDLKLDTKIIKNIKIPNSHRNTFSLTGFNRQASRISFNKKGKLVLNITYSYITPMKFDNCKSFKSSGTIGIDIGPKEIAVCYVKKDGNPIMYQHYNTGELLDARKAEKVRLLSEILEQIFSQGMALGIHHVSIENLDKLNFKRTGNKALNRMLSKFPKTIFEDLVVSKCARKGFKLNQVNPAYTSIIGLYKFSNRDNLSFAHTSNSKDLSAALAIGRRGLGIVERAVVCFRKSGRTVSFTASSLFPSAEHDGNTGRNRSPNPFFWHKIAELVRQTLTEISKAEPQKRLYSPSLMADILEMRVIRRRNSALASIDWNAPENILTF